MCVNISLWLVPLITFLALLLGWLCWCCSSRLDFSSCGRVALLMLLMLPAVAVLLASLAVPGFPVLLAGLALLRKYACTFVAGGLAMLIIC